MKSFVSGVNRRATKPLDKITPIPRDCLKQYTSRDLGRPSRGGGKSGYSKAGDDEPRHLRRPCPGEQIGNYRPGHCFPPACSLQLDVRAEAELGEQSNRLPHCRNSLPRKGGAEPTPRVVTAERGERERAGFAAPIGRAFEPIIMKEDRLVVGSEANVKLDPLAPEGFGRAQAR
jgi:hypothetical protein